MDRLTIMPRRNTGSDEPESRLICEDGTESDILSIPFDVELKSYARDLLHIVQSLRDIVCNETSFSKYLLKYPGKNFYKMKSKYRLRIVRLIKGTIYPTIVMIHNQVKSLMENKHFEIYIDGFNVHDAVSVRISDVINQLYTRTGYNLLTQSFDERTLTVIE